MLPATDRCRILWQGGLRIMVEREVKPYILLLKGEYMGLHSAAISELKSAFSLVRSPWTTLGWFGLSSPWI
jgi:hypothetical protein